MPHEVFAKATRNWHALGNFVLFLCVLAAPGIAGATDYSSTNFIVRDPVITIGGGNATSSSFQLISSFGQTIIGENTSSNFIQRAGFLYFPAPVSPTPTPSPAPPAGGGGATGQVGILPIVNFFGTANSGDTVFLLKDGQLVDSVGVGTSGSFFMRQSGMSPGIYIFSLYAERQNGTRSGLLTFPVEVFSFSVINITDIFFGPVIRRDLTEQPCADPNQDNRVDLVDFSILIFWFEKPNVPPHIDCNGDSTANLTDFSIMAYYWTG